MKTILLSLSIFIFNLSLSHGQTKKIALRSHSGSNSSFTIYVPDEFGLGPIDYNYPKPSKKKKSLLNIQAIKPSQIQVKDSMDSIQFCTPLPEVDQKSQQQPTPPKSEPRGTQEKTIKAAKKSSTTIPVETRSQQVATPNNSKKAQLAGFTPKESSESLLILLLSIPALLFFIISTKKS